MSPSSHQLSIQHEVLSIKYGKIIHMKSIIKYDDFAKLDLRVGTVIECENKIGSENLLRLTVDFGAEGKRNILSGIAKWYTPSEIKGGQYVFIINLEPRKLMSEESEGMILAADINTANETNDKPILIKPQSEAPNGSTIK